MASIVRIDSSRGTSLGMKPCQPESVCSGGSRPRLQYTCDESRTHSIRTDGWFFSRSTVASSGPIRTYPSMPGVNESWTSIECPEPRGANGSIELGTP